MVSFNIFLFKACYKKAKSLCNEPASFVVANGISMHSLTPTEFHFFLKEQLKHYLML
jgi:hypothetical protein